MGVVEESIGYSVSVNCLEIQVSDTQPLTSKTLINSLLSKQGVFFFQLIIYRKKRVFSVPLSLQYGYLVYP